MLTNTDFGKFLYELRPQSNAARLTLYNYIRNFSDLNSPFLPDTILKFYFKALSYEHWQKNNLELAQEVRFILAKLSETKPLDENWKKLKHSDEIQVLRFFHKTDLLEMIHHYFKNKRLNYNFKVYSDKGSTAHAVLVFPHGPVHVYSFDDQAAIINGQLRPLSLDRKLEYTSELELAKNIKQSLLVSQFVATKFSLNQEVITGEYIRGYTLQAYKRFEAYSLQEELQILYTVKKIERFFIDRATEPLYVELIQVLEQTLQFLKKNHPGSQELAQKAYLRGVNALENLFVDDKMIPILLKEIESHLKQTGLETIKEANWKTQFDSTNISHKQDWPAEEPPTN